MNDVKKECGEFRLSELEDRLGVLLEEKDKNIHRYICCEHVGEPWSFATATV